MKKVLPILIIVVCVLNFLYTFGYQGPPMSQFEFLACSSDDSEPSNNFNSQEKLISSMNVSLVDFSEGETPNEFFRSYRQVSHNIS